MSVNLTNVQILRDYLDEVRPEHFRMGRWDACICGYAMRAIASEEPRFGRLGDGWANMQRGMALLGLDEEEATSLFSEGHGLNYGAGPIDDIDDAIAALDWILANR